jgi:hypothetical protein
MGLGLSNSVAATVALDVTMLAAGVAVYTSARPKALSQSDSLGFWAFLTLLGLLYPGTVHGDPPPNVTVVAVTALSGCLAQSWAAWFGRNCVPRRASGALS